MKENILSFWNQRTAAERRTITIGGGTLVIALIYAFVWHPLQQERNRLQASLPQLRTAAAQFHADAAEVVRLRASAPKQSQSKGDLQAAIESAAARTGLGKPAQLNPLDSGRARIAYNVAAFDAWIKWLKIMQTEQAVRVESLAINALAEPGMVKIQAVLAAPGRSFAQTTQAAQSAQPVNAAPAAMPAPRQALR